MLLGALGGAIVVPATPILIARAVGTPGFSWIVAGWIEFASAPRCSPWCADRRGARSYVCVTSAVGLDCGADSLDWVAELSTCAAVRPRWQPTFAFSLGIGGRVRAALRRRRLDDCARVPCTLSGAPGFRFPTDRARLSGDGQRRTKILASSISPTTWPCTRTGTRSAYRSGSVVPAASGQASTASASASIIQYSGTPSRR